MTVNGAPVQTSSISSRLWSGLRAAPFPRESLVFGCVLAILAMLPALVATYPQMVDFPAHMARYQVMLHRDDHPFLAQYYGFHWLWVGNLGVDILMIPLGQVFDVETAGRIVVAAIPLLMALSILSVEWALRRRIGVASPLAFLFIWQPALLMGFVNYMLSLALALFAFALWVELRGKRWRWIPFLPIGVAVWLCHVSGWGVLGLMVFGYEWNREKSWRSFLAPWPLTLPILALQFGGGSKGLFSYGPNPMFFKQILWARAMRDHIQWLDMASLGFVALVLVATVALRRVDGRLAWGALIMMLGSLAMPRHIVGGDYADYRLISSGLLAACLAISWRAPRWVFYLAPALFLGRLAVTTETWATTSRETATMLTALDLLPQGAKVANVIAIERRRWAFNPWEHICGYAVIRKDALSNCNFALPHVHMLSEIGPGPHWNDPTQRLFVWPWQVLDLRRYKPLRTMDYLWFVGDRPPILPPRAEVIYRDQRSMLVRLANAPHDG